MVAKHASPLQALLVDSSFDGEMFADEPMAKHTSYRIGGPARFFVRADSISALSDIVSCCAGCAQPYFLVGRGTNLLVSDEGYGGVIITLGRDFKNLSADRDSGRIVVGAGALLSTVVQEALRQSLSGMEFAVGTPGSIGGALRMNAGTKDDWIGSRVRSVTVLKADGRLEKIFGDDVRWGYRTTSFLPSDVILECELVLTEGDSFFIRGKMEGNLSRRKRAQPMGLPSCGSVFRNPAGHSAAKLIDDAGLKGLACGGAQISEKHANFIVNRGGAQAVDVIWLMNEAKRKVEATYGITLAPEVKFLGF